MLDRGNALVSLALPVPAFGRISESFARITEWLSDGLARVGIPGVERRGTSDLALGNRKIGGACIYRSRDLLLYSATLLVDPDIVRMARWLPHPPREPDWRGGRRHAEFVGTVRAAGPQPATGREWTAPSLSAALENVLDIGSFERSGGS